METAWKKRLVDLMDQKQVNMKQLSLSAGLGETYIRDVLKRGRDPHVTQMLAVCQVLGVSISDIFEGSEPIVPAIPIIGYAYSEGWVPNDDDGNPIKIDVGSETAGLIVKGDSMAPVYKDGYLIAGNKKQGESISRWLGHDCIVLTSTGERHVKYLAKSPIRGRFNLKSYNPSDDDVEGRRLEWAAPITWIRRNIGK